MKKVRRKRIVLADTIDALYKTRIDAAIDFKINPDRLSKFLNGQRALTEDELKRIKRKLGMSQEKFERVCNKLERGI